MRRCVAMLIALALCIGGLAYAHHAITLQEEQLTVIPITTVGDPSVLAGRTAAMDITCGEHLTWRTGYAFGSSATTTKFTFNPKDPPYLFSDGRSSYFSIRLGGGFGAGTSGYFTISAPAGYYNMIKAVADETPAGSTKSSTLKMKDYVDYYCLDYEVTYEDDALYCYEYYTLANSISGDNWGTEWGTYNRFQEQFKFPVGDADTVSITIGKNEAGQVCDVDFFPEKETVLEFLGTVNREGLWFVPVFQREGQSQEAELPEGMGIYHIPWRDTGESHNYYQDGKTHTRAKVTPDVENAENIYPISQDMLVVDLVVPDGSGTMWLLTLEHGNYVFRVIDLLSGKATHQLELMSPGEYSAHLDYNNQYVTVITGEMLALIDRADFSLKLMAPTGAAWETLCYNWDADYGTLEYDGEQLILTNTARRYEDLFWIAVLSHSGLEFYGKYDCSLLQGNDYWYYDSVSAYREPIELGGG